MENNGWINVESPPCEQGYYLCYSPYYEQPFVILEWDADLGDFLDDASDITHWTILPEPPVD